MILAQPTAESDTAVLLTNRPRRLQRYFLQRLCRGGGKFGGDVQKCLVDIAGQGAHRSSRTEGNQSDHQCVLDKILALFVGQQGPKFDRQH